MYIALNAVNYSDRNWPHNFKIISKQYCITEKFIFEDVKF